MIFNPPVRRFQRHLPWQLWDEVIVTLFWSLATHCPLDTNFSSIKLFLAINSRWYRQQSKANRNPIKDFVSSTRSKVGFCVILSTLRYINPADAWCTQCYSQSLNQRRVSTVETTARIRCEYLCLCSAVLYTLLIRPVLYIDTYAVTVIIFIFPIMVSTL